MQKISSTNIKPIFVKSKGTISSPFIKSANYKIADAFVSKQALQQKSKPMFFASLLLTAALFIAQKTKKVNDNIQASKEISKEQADINAKKEALDEYKKIYSHKPENFAFIEKNVNAENIKKFKILVSGVNNFTVYDNSDFLSILENIDNIDEHNLKTLINKKDDKFGYNTFYSATIQNIVKNLKPENNDSLKEILSQVGDSSDGKDISQFAVNDLLNLVNKDNKKVLSTLLNFKTDNGYFYIDSYCFPIYLENLTNKYAKFIPKVYDYKCLSNDTRLYTTSGNIELCKCFADKKTKETALKIIDTYKPGKFQIHRFKTIDGLKDFCVKFNNEEKNKNLKRIFHEKLSNGDYKYNNLKDMLEISNALDKKSTNTIMENILKLKDKDGNPKIKEFDAEAIKNIKPNFNISLFDELLNIKSDSGLDLKSIVNCTNKFRTFKGNFPIPEKMPQIRNDEFSNVMTNIFDLSKNSLLVRNFNFSQKNNIKITLEEILNNPKNDFENMPFDVKELKNTVDKSFSKIISISNVSKNNQIKLFNNVLANKPEVENIIKNANFEDYKKEGLPLSYPRKEFIKDLTLILDNLSNSEQEKILKKLEISLTEDKKGYNGILNLLDNPTNETEKQISKLVESFIKNNKVQTGDSELDNTLNSLLSGMPEFVNIIGKQQHANHDFSVDVHILTVLKNVLKDENFKKLSSQKQFELKTAILMHDIAKTENTVDKTHQTNSALYSTNILSRYSMSKITKDNIYELIKEHHWLEDLNNNLKPELIAAKIRTKENYEALKIMTKADLKSCSDSINNSFKHLLNNENQKALAEIFDNIDKNGNLIFSSKIINKNKIPKINYNGKTYRVLDFPNISDTEDLSSVGFMSGTKKSDLAFFVHGNEKANNLNSVKELDNIINGSVLSESLITLQNSKMYWNIPYGVILENENKNIATAYFSNQASGYEKTFETWANSLFSDHYRTLVPKTIKSNLDLSDEEYTELFRQLENKKHISQIKDETIYNIGDKNLTGKQIKNAVFQAQEELLKNTNDHNEIVAYNSKVVGLLAKVNSIKEIKTEMLDFAYEKDLPIYLLGQQI